MRALSEADRLEILLRPAGPFRTRHGAARMRRRSLARHAIGRQRSGDPSTPPSRAGRSCCAASTSPPAARMCWCHARGDLLAVLGDRPQLHGARQRFRHLFGSWFNRGFLVLRRIDWRRPANVLEKIIRYEAVHEIRGWDDLRRRLEPPDRRCFAFFHPALVDEPLIFVEVALTSDIPAASRRCSSGDRTRCCRRPRRTAVFYSISNCQEGLRGISFGNFLIKQVVEELKPRTAGARHLRHAVAGAGFRPLARASRAGDFHRRRGRAEHWLRTTRRWPDAPRRAPSAPRKLLGQMAGALSPCRQDRDRPAARSGGALPSRQWRAARAHQCSATPRAGPAPKPPA